MENMIDGLVVEFFLPCAMLTGAFVVAAVVVEVTGRIDAKRKGIKHKSIF
jgi:hypothetical protein